MFFSPLVIETSFPCKIASVRVKNTRVLLSRLKDTSDETRIAYTNALPEFVVNFANETAFHRDVVPPGAQL